MNRREFPGGPGVRIRAFTAEDMGSILSEELRSLKLCGTAIKKKKRMSRSRDVMSNVV